MTSDSFEDVLEIYSPQMRRGLGSPFESILFCRNDEDVSTYRLCLLPQVCCISGMGIDRYELSDVQWEKLEGFLPGRVEHVGRTASDNRLFVNGVLWALRSGTRWHDLPERYGKYKSVHKRFSRWAKSGVWKKVFHELLRDRKNQYLVIDSTIVRERPAEEHQASADATASTAPH